MKHWLTVCALSVALFVAPLEAATKEKFRQSKAKIAKKDKIAKPSDIKKETVKHETQAKKNHVKKESKKYKGHTKKEKKYAPAKTKKVKHSKPSFKAEKSIAKPTPVTKSVPASRGARVNKVIGTTGSGKTLYEGPLGGHFYYTDSGNKEYVEY